ncbi:von Willebrand factor-like [Dendrobates tinctorius]|uniref:von Willebrand factor-like n=1 Tax=Dendrobates tinctorius TaxID=92724 RepID=UPI003CC991CB
MGRTSAVLLASLTLLLMVFTAQSAATRCKTGEEHNDCGSACPPTCKNRSPICAAVCVPGCFCKNGTIRNDKGECVMVEKCCSGNTEYQQCGSACPPTCDNRSPVCTKVCTPGCFCKKGTIRNVKGECVKVEKCCSGNTEYQQCGSACPPTCKNRSPICAAVCKSGCFCKKGTIRNDKGECVTVEKCCSGNTEYQGCGNDCPNTCAAHNSPEPVMCTMQCSTGCFCKPGYKRLPNSKECVLPKYCPKSSNYY